MRTNLANIVARSKVRLASQGTTVTVRWVTFTGGSLDPLTGTKVGATSTPASSTVNAFVHFVGPATSGFRVYEEIQVGDAILDMDPDADIDGKDGIHFEFAGEKWVQKSVGESLAKSWDTLFGNQKVFRSILVRRKT
jgi:hypothetical protein